MISFSAKGTKIQDVHCSEFHLLIGKVQTGICFDKIYANMRIRLLINAVGTCRPTGVFL